MALPERLPFIRNMGTVKTECNRSLLAEYPYDDVLKKWPTPMMSFLISITVTLYAISSPGFFAQPTQ